jgi:hypothetical protein
MGGTERYLGPKARLGFHSSRGFLNKNNPRYNDLHESSNENIVRYLQRMGMTEVDGKRLISAPPDSMTWVNVDNLATYGIAAYNLLVPPKVVWPSRASANR